MIQEPSYFLEGVVRARDEMEDFSGPLDLILMLLAKNKIEIRDIRIGELLDQYMDYLHQMQEMDLEIASEFVQMASHLTYIKTKMLLTEEKEPTELEVLVNALEQMKNKEAIAAVRENVSRIDAMSKTGLLMQTRGPLPREDRPYDYHHTPLELVAALADMLLRAGGEKVEEEEFQNLRKAVPKPLIYNVRDKSRQIVRLLLEREDLPLSELFSLCQSRSELVATFLSVLELCSAGQAAVTGESAGYTVRRTEDTTMETETNEE